MSLSTGIVLIATAAGDVVVPTRGATKKQGRGRPSKPRGHTLLTTPAKPGKAWRKGQGAYPTDVVRRYCAELDALKRSGRASSDLAAIRVKTLEQYRSLGWTEAKCQRVLAGDQKHDLNRLAIIVNRFRKKEKARRELIRMV